jgi:chromosome segregation ATPase
MSNATDMSTPVTRGELREELTQLETRFDQKLDIWAGALMARINAGEHRLANRIDGLEQRMDGLERRMDGLEQRMDGLERRMDGLEQRMGRLEQQLGGLEERLLAALAQHTKAIHESISMQVSMFDEKYADLPARVQRLEAQVFSPRRR